MTSHTRIRCGAAAVIAWLGAAVPAFAHPGHGPMSGFLTGLNHPLSGADHLLAMVAVGLWAGLAGGQRQWLWPALFVSSMVLGCIAGVTMVMPTLPAEPLILASVLVLGLAVASGFRAPLALGGGLIALFGLAHGYAHGLEMPHDVQGLDFAAGFTLATAALHATGLAAAIGLGRLRLDTVTRFAGMGIAMAGLGLIFGG